MPNASRSPLQKLLIAASLMVGLAAGTTGASAGSWYDPFVDEWFGIPVSLPLSNKDAFGMSLIFDESPPILGGPASAAAPSQKPAAILNAVYQVDNSAFTVESGEPNPGGKMKRTVWRRYVADRDGRVAVNTYGSSRFGPPLDTVLAVYEMKGSASPSGKPIALGDDKKVAGASDRTASFVTFDVEKGKSYAIQIGDKDDDGGDVLMTAFTFPPAGGLTVQPPNAYGGYDYFCARPLGSSGTCDDAAFVVANATSKTLLVEASGSDLGPGVAAPAPFTLAPGEAALKTFTFGTDFGGAAAGVKSGGLTFTGSAGGKTVARTTFPARVAIHDGSAAAPELEIAATSEVLSGPTGEPVYRVLKVKNVGAVGASGCYVATDFNETTLQTAWAGYDRATGKVNTQPYAPFAVPAGDSADIVVALRSFRDRLADPAFARPFKVACASGPSFTTSGQLDLRNTIDVSNNVKAFSSLRLVGSDPSAGVLSVKPSGSVMAATFRNQGAKDAVVTAKIAERSNQTFGGPKRYTLSICKAGASDAACLASTAQSIDLKIPAGKTATVKVAAKPPAEDPGFDPAQIGLVLTLSQPYSDVFSTPVLVGGLTKALKLR